jgi:hypothetical protein
MKKGDVCLLAEKYDTILFFTVVLKQIGEKRVHIDNYYMSRKNFNLIYIRTLTGTELAKFFLLYDNPDCKSRYELTPYEEQLFDL